MAPGRGSSDDQARDEAIGKLWDALQESGALGTSGLDAEDIETITLLHTAEDGDAPDEESVEYMWAVIQAGTGLTAGALSATAPARASATAMKEAPVAAIGEAVTPGLANSPVWSLRKPFGVQVTKLVRLCTLAVVASFIPGFLILGGGARIAMRVAAMMSSDQLQGATTENAETVGHISLGGTLALMMQGWFGGIALTLVFVAIRPCLPANGWRRSVVAGFIFFIASGSVVLENGENADYERFGIAGVNICLFTVLPLFFGIVIGPATDWFDTRISPSMPRLSKSPWVLFKSALMVFTAYIAVMVSIFLIAEPSALTILLLLPVIVWLGEIVVRRFGVADANRLVLRLSYGGLGVACLVGLLMTAQAVGRIL